MSENNGVMGKIQKWVLPIGNFLSSQKHFASVSAGLQATVGIAIISAFVQIAQTIVAMFAKDGMIATRLGIEFGWAANVSNILKVPYDMTMGLMAVVVAFAIAYNLAKYYKMNQMTSGIVAMLMFIMIVAPVQTVVLEDGASTFSGLATSWLGATGIFTAILVSLLSVEISHFCIKRNWVVKMPDVVPSFLQDSFTSMIPLFLNVVILYGINVALSMINPALNIATATTQLFMVPVSAVIGSVPGMFVIIAFALLLWTVGVHGTMIVYPLLLPIMIEAISKNAELVAAGQSPVFNASLLFGAAAIAGGTGNTFGLVLLSKFKAKSEQLKAISTASLVPGVFGVNEPVIFGVPIAFNPFMAIPFILQGLVVALLMFLAYQFNLMTPGYILIMSLMPIGVGNFLGSMDWRNFVFAWLMVPVTAVVYYPFFKIYDAQLYAKEQEAAKIEAQAQADKSEAKAVVAK